MARSCAVFAGLAMMATVFVSQVEVVSASDPPSSTWGILPLDRATGINDKGMVVGFIGGDIARWTPLGGTTILGPHDWWYGTYYYPPYPPSINNNGDVASTTNGHAFYWSSDTEELTPIYLEGGGPSFAVDINNEGQVTGVAYSPTYGGRRFASFIWPDPNGNILNIAKDIGPVIGEWYSEYDFVCGLNDQGQVLGSSHDWWSYLWQGGRDWGPDATPEIPEMLNLDGWIGCEIPDVAGRLNNLGEVLSPEYRAVYRYPTGWHILPSGDAEWSSASAINDAGQVLGNNWLELGPPYDWWLEMVLWNPTPAGTWELQHLGMPDGTHWCEKGYLNDQGAVAAACWGSFGHSGETVRTFLWTPAGGWSEPLPTPFATGDCSEWDSDGTCIHRLDWSEPRGINEKSQIVADSFVGEDDDYQYDLGDPVYTRALLYDPLISDVDGDGFDNDFEAGFGGNIKLTNPETGDSASWSGSAEDGSVITSGSFSVEFPAGTKVADDAPQIEMTFGSNGDMAYSAVISGADLNGGTKTVTMPFADYDWASVCIDDQVSVPPETHWWCTDGQTRVWIPEDGEHLHYGYGPNGEVYRIERVSTDPPLVRISGLTHTTLMTIIDRDLDGIPDWDDRCPAIPGVPEKQGCPLREPVPPEVTITAPSSGFLTPVNTPVIFSGSFTDENLEDTHTAVWTFDNTQVPCIEPCILTESGGSGTVEYTRVFESPGVYTVSLTVTDSSGLQGQATTVNNMPDMPAFVVIYDPMGGFVTGGGWINSPPNAYSGDTSLTGKATFGFVAKYKKGATVPDGQTEFQFKVAILNFHSTSYDWLVCGGAKCQFKGKGTINGIGNYGFLLSAIDGQLPGGGGADKLRMKIWDIVSGQVIYDNQPGSGDFADPTTVIGGGSIVIHKG